MPPRLQLLRRAAVASPFHQSYQPLAPFLYPFLGQQRAASILSSLSDRPGAYNKRIRVGRGPASGKGKTSGRGHKGQKQHGKVPEGFNGGQTPEWVVAGARGFDNAHATDMAPINLNRIQLWINKGRLDPTKPITMKELKSTRCVHNVRDGIKLLARGKEELTSPIHLVVSRASAEAINIVEQLGGSVTTRYYTPFAIKKIFARDMDPIHSLRSQIDIPLNSVEGATSTEKPLARKRRQYRYRLPDPTSRKDLEYYRDAAHRGYLSHTVADGESPSLFFRTPGAVNRNSVKKVSANKPKTLQQKVDNRIW